MKSKLFKKAAALLISAALIAQSGMILPLSASADASLTITEAEIDNGAIKSITVDGTSTTAAKGIVAVYSADKALKDVAFTSENVNAGGSFELSEPVAYNAETDTYRVFVWEVKDGKLVPNPLANAYKSPAATDTPVTTGTPAAATGTPAAATGTPAAATGTPAAATGTPAAATSTPAPVKYAVTVAAAENGTVTANKTTAAKDETVTLTVTPADGYLLDTLTVKDADNGEVTVTNNTFKMPAKAVTVTATFVADTALYREKVNENKTISTAMAQTDFADANNTTAEDVLPFSVADFGTGNEKVTAVPSLDGWGYKHFAFSGMMKDGAFQAGRQSNASMNKDENAVYANGIGNSGCDGAVSFIPANNATVAAKLPTTGTIVYTFDAIAYVGTAINKDRAMTFGLTSATDGTSVANVASTTIAIPSNTTAGTKITKKMVMTYSIDKKSYTISADGEMVASGITQTPVTGIYALTDKNGSYHNAGIANLVITTKENSPVAAFTVTGAQEEVKDDKGNVVTPAETASINKTVADAEETVTVTTNKNAGRKVTVTVKDADNGDVAVTAGANGTYTFTMPAKDVTVTVEFARADVNTIEVAGPKTVSSAAVNKYTATVKDADGTVLDAAVTWSVTGGGDGTSIAADGTLTVADAEADQTALTIKAAAEGKEGTLAAKVTKATVYTITKAEDLTGGSVATDKIVGIEGDEVTVTPEAAAGYHVTAVTYTPAEGTPQTITVAEGVYKFTMPAANVTVSATFAKTDYTITNNTAEADKDTNHGFVAVSKSPANYQDDVTVTITPSAGYQLDTLTVKDASNTDVEVTDGKFKMPASNVTISATFKAFEYTSITVAPTTATQIVVNKSAEVQTVPMTATLVGADTSKAAAEGEVTWTATGVDGVTISTAGVLSIPANTTGTVTVTATGTGDNTAKNGTATVRIDPELATKTGSTTKIYVANDYQSYAGSSISSTTSDNAQPKTGEAAFKELVLNTNGNYKGEATLEFDTSSVADVIDKIYSVTLKVPGGYGYQGGTRNAKIKANNIDSKENVNQATGTDNRATVSEFDVTSDFLTKNAENKYTVLMQNTQGWSMSISSRESDTRGAYLEVAEGNVLAVTYTADDVAVADLDVTVTGPNGFSKTVKTDENGVAKVIVPAITEETTYTFATATGEYSATSKEVKATGDSIENTQALSANTAQPASLKVSYRTAADDDSTEIKNVEFPLTDDQKFADQEITIPETYKATQLIAVGETGKSKAYVYASGYEATKTLAAGENTLVIVVTAVDGEFSFYEDFSGAANDWAGLGTWGDTGRNPVQTVDNGAFKFGIASDNKRTKGFSTLENAITLAEGSTIEFDAYFNPASNNAGRPTIAEYAFGDDKGNVLFAIRTSTDSTTFKAYAGQAIGTNVTTGKISTATGDPAYGTNPGANGAVELKNEENSLNNTANWHHVKAQISGDNIIVSINVKDSTDVYTTTIANADKTNTLKYFSAFIDQGSLNGSGSYLMIDNIVIK